MTTSDLDNLKSLPHELRDQIFSYLLVSPSGVVQSYGPGPWPVILRPWNFQSLAIFHDSDPLDFMPLFLTCRQFFQQCRDILYQKNAFLISLGEIDRYVDVIECGKETFWRRIQHIIIEYPVFGAWGLGVYKNPSISKLSPLSRVASIRQITLVLEPVKTGNEFRMLLKKRGAIAKYEAGSLAYSSSRTGAAFYRETLEDMKATTVDLPHIKLKVLLYTRPWDERSAGLNQVRPQSHNIVHFSPDYLLREIHAHLGSELWVDDCLCYEDGVEIVKPFDDLPTFGREVVGGLTFTLKPDGDYDRHNPSDPWLS